jgi:hypothetical protein
MKYIDSKIKSSIFLKNFQIQKQKDKINNQISVEDLEKFKKDPTTNPKTGRRIAPQGKIYQQYQQLLQKDGNTQPKIIVKKFRDHSPKDKIY